MLSRFLTQLLQRAKPGRAADELDAISGAVKQVTAGQQAEREGRFEEALRCYDDGMMQFPDSAELRAMRGNVLRGLGRSDDAVAAYREAVALKPAFAAAWYNLALTEHELGDARAAERDYRGALAADPGLAAAHDSLLCLVGMGEAGDGTSGGAGRAPEAVLAEHRRWAALVADRLRDTWKPFANTADPGRRLRIGYVSADLRRHAIACFIEPILAHRDRSAFEVFCYDNHGGTDPVKDRLRGLVDGWRAIDALDDDAAAEAIRADCIDLLVDLSGHTRGNRLLVFARKPAPVQLTYLGYPNSSGLAAIDYRVTDAAADPPGMTESHYVEGLLRMPHSMWCYRPFDDMPAVGPRGESEGGVVFGSMNSCIKLNAGVICVWAQLMREVAGSRLVAAAVPAGSAQQRLLAAFAAEGVGHDRIECAPRLGNEGFWALHQRVDIALDPFPMNGGTTTCESLWMGVPVVTLEGRSFASRAGSSLLRAAGHPEWIAASPDEYVRIAADLARDPARRAALRSGMRERLLRSHLFDEAQFARDLDGLYRTAWRAWCARQS